MKTTIRRIGNSRGVLIPKALLLQSGLHDEVDLVIENGQLVLRPVTESVRVGWAEASREIAAVRDDAPEWRELPNDEDEDLVW